MRVASELWKAESARPKKVISAAPSVAASKRDKALRHIAREQSKALREAEIMRLKQ